MQKQLSLSLINKQERPHQTVIANLYMDLLTNQIFQNINAAVYQTV